VTVLETEWWNMALAPEWWAELEDDTVVVGDEDGVGCLEFSTLLKEGGAFGADEVQAIAREESPGVSGWKAVTCGDFSGMSASFMEDAVAVREWYLAAGEVLLFISYSCDRENRGMDDAAVDALLDTLSRV